MPLMQPTRPSSCWSEASRRSSCSSTFRDGSEAVHPRVCRQRPGGLAHGPAPPGLGGGCGPPPSSLLKSTECAREAIYKGRLGSEGSQPFPRAPCTFRGIYKGAFPLVRTTGVCFARSSPCSKSPPHAFFNSLLVELGAKLALSCGLRDNAWESSSGA